MRTLGKRVYLIGNVGSNPTLSALKYTLILAVIMMIQIGNDFP